MMYNGAEGWKCRMREIMHTKTGNHLEALDSSNVIIIEVTFTIATIRSVACCIQNAPRHYIRIATQGF